jgi:hypothetical protein
VQGTYLDSLDAAFLDIVGRVLAQRDKRETKGKRQKNQKEARTHNRNAKLPAYGFWLENDPGIQFAFADGEAPLTADYPAIGPAFTKHRLNTQIVAAARNGATT